MVAIIHPEGLESHLGGNVAGGDPDTYFPDLWAWLVKEYEIKTVVDIGSAEGHAVAHFRSLGCNAIGIEGWRRNCRVSEEPTICADLRNHPLEVHNVDLVWSCEVLEHLDALAEHHFLESVRFSKYLAMTHCGPKGRGWHHVNCQTDEYWIKKFRGIGFKFLRQGTALSREKAHGHWATSGQLFARKNEDELV